MIREMGELGAETAPLTLLPIYMHVNLQFLRPSSLILSSPIRTRYSLAFSPRQIYALIWAPRRPIASFKPRTFYSTTAFAAIWSSTTRPRFSPSAVPYAHRCSSMRRFVIFYPNRRAETNGRVSSVLLLAFWPFTSVRSSSARVTSPRCTTGFSKPGQRVEHSMLSPHPA